MTSPAATDPPTDFTVTNEAGSLSYTFSWGPPLELYDTVILSYRVHCTPLLEGVAPVDYKTLDDTIFTATLDLGYGLPYNCCVQASNAGGLSNVTCLIGGPITTPQISEYSGNSTVLYSVSFLQDLLDLHWRSKPLPVPLTSPSPGTLPPPPTVMVQSLGTLSGVLGPLPSLSPPPPPPTPSPTSFLIPTTCAPSLPVTERVMDQLLNSPPPLWKTVSGSLSVCGSSERYLSPTVPDTAPLGFTHSVENGTSDVMFQWRPPPADTTNGVIIHYTVSCNSSETLTLTPDLSLSVSSLTPATYYSCSVSASTSAGEGPHSNARTVLTGQLLAQNTWLCGNSVSLVTRRSWVQIPVQS